MLQGGRIGRLIGFVSAVALGLLALGQPVLASVVAPEVECCLVAPKAARHLCSFSGETEVLMADGTTKPISEVEVGDWMLTEYPETGDCAREVTHLWVHQDTIIDLEIDGHDVATTEDHPFWNATDSEWQSADVLDVGDLVVTVDGATLTVDGLDWGSARTTTAYNLTVDDIHTYYVQVVDDEVLVHNVCEWTTRSRLRAAGPGEEFGLPSQGRIRYVPPENYNPANPLPRGPQNGYLDRFGNEWVVGSSRTPGQQFEWDVQLSRTGQNQIGWLSTDASHVNVSPLGEVTH